MIQLICEGDCLYTPRSAILLKMHDAGYCDTIKWPDYDASDLRSALYDARETGCIPADTKDVLLPDETVFEIE